MFLRPVLILVCGMLLFNLPTLIYKVGMFVRGLIYLLMCNDKKWRKPQDPNNFFGPLLQKGEKIERKTIYFVRHSESTWNDTFNKGNHRSTTAFVIGFIPGLIKALLYELYLILSGKLDRSVNQKNTKRCCFSVSCLSIACNDFVRGGNDTNTYCLF